MFTIYVTYKGSDRAAVEGFYKEIREIGIDILSRKEDGNVRYEYYWPAEHENQLFLLEIWETKEKLSRYIHSRLTLKSWESSKKNTALKPALKLHKHLFNNVIGNLNDVSKICY